MSAPLRTQSAIPAAVRFEAIAALSAPDTLATDSFGTAYSIVFWAPSRLPRSSLRRYASRLFEVANDYENLTAAAGSTAARRSDRLMIFTRSYFTTLYMATVVYLEELASWGVDIDDGDQLLVLENEFPDFVTTYVLPDTPPSPIHPSS